MKIALLYGTETGNAEMLCGDLRAHLASDHEVVIHNLEDIDPADLDGSYYHIFVCSTYGVGDLPTSAESFANALEANATDLSHVHFAIFGLGDSEYETFNQGSEKLAALLLKHGAKQHGERKIYDASGEDLAEDLAIPWIDGQIADAAALMGEA